MDKALITVVVPVYNTASNLLRKCIESIINQRYENIEILIVDDGSTNVETISLCHNLESEFDTIQVIHKQNGGLSSARNTGVRNAKGEYIAFVDSDDYIERDFYFNLISDIEQYNVLFAIGSIVIENSGNKKYKKDDLNGVYDHIDIMHHFLLGKWHSACTNLYHKSLFSDVLFPEKEINEDYLFNFEIIRKVKRISVNNKSYYHYIKQENSITTSHASLKHFDWIKHTNYVREELRKFPQIDFSHEADFQYLFCNIVLANKSLISISDGYTDESRQLFNIVISNLGKEKKTILKNPFFETKYRFMGLLLSFFPKFYAALILVGLIIKNGRVSICIDECSQ